MNYSYHILSSSFYLLIIYILIALIFLALLLHPPMSRFILSSKLIAQLAGFQFIN